MAVRATFYSLPARAYRRNVAAFSNSPGERLHIEAQGRWHP
jgi:hypothetical protein